MSSHSSCQHVARNLLTKAQTSSTMRSSSAMWEEVVLGNCHALDEVVDLRSGLKDVTASRGARVGQEGEGNEDRVQVLRVTCVKA